jgi:hypothetical protein
MRSRCLRISLVIGALIGAGACDANTGWPTVPGPVPGPTILKVRSLTITGNTSLSAPGETSRLTATATFIDGTTRDVTADAQWSSSNNDPLTDIVSVISGGLIRAVRYGKGRVRATYGSDPSGFPASVTVDVRVAPGGAYLVSVDVSDGHWAMDGALVQVTSPVGSFSVTTNLWGFANLPARGDATLKVEKEGFRVVTQSLDVSSDQNIRIVLQSSNAAGLTANRVRSDVRICPVFVNCGMPQLLSLRTFSPVT